VARCGDAALYVEALATLEAGRLPPGLALAAGGRLKVRAARLLGVPAEARRYSLGAITGLVAVTLIAVSVAVAQPGAPAPAVAQIDFTGNKAFDAETLKAQIRDGERSVPALTANNNYGPDRRAYDGELLGHFYTNNGYADAKISSAVAGGGASSHVTFTVAEGRQYRIGQVTINPKTAALLTPMLSFKSGDIFDASKVKAALDAAPPQVRLHLQRDPGGKPIMNIAIDVEPDQKATTLERRYDVGMKPPALLPSAANGRNVPVAPFVELQFPGKKGVQPPITIHADNARENGQGMPTLLEGNVTVQQGGITIRADAVRIELAPPSPGTRAGSLTRLIADGHVVLTSDGRTVTNDHLEIEVNENALKPQSDGSPAAEQKHSEISDQMKLQLARQNHVTVSPAEVDARMAELRAKGALPSDPDFRSRVVAQLAWEKTPH
jgi:hypothetical protein